MDIDLNKYIARANKSIELVQNQPKGIKEEMKAFELTGERSKSLQLLYEALKTICPASVLSEREHSQKLYIFVAPRLNSL